MSASPQGMGKVMIAVAFIMTLGLLTLFFESMLDRRNNPNQHINTHYDTERGYKQVVLQQNQGSHYVTTGTINGEPVTFLLDTGATRVSIPENVARRLDLRRGSPMQANTANGSITIYNTEVQSVAIGEIALSDVRASINPHMDGDEVLLGMSFLRHLTLIQQGNTLILRQPLTTLD